MSLVFSTIFAPSTKSDSGEISCAKTGDPPEAACLAERFTHVRTNSLNLSAPLSHEDWMLQSMEDASPIKWHLAHTTWFFETFILQPHQPGYTCFHEDFGYLFNSYYQQVGAMHRRADRGLLSRPSANEVLAYRAHVDAAICQLLKDADANTRRLLTPLMHIGFAHEEQHQELMQTDILHGLYQNKLLPAAYLKPDMPVKGSMNEGQANPPSKTKPAWVAFDGGLVEIGASGQAFAFDNEFPRHKFWLNPFELAVNLVTNRDYLDFIDAGGYQDPQYWLSDGWALVQAKTWFAPLYWRQTAAGTWRQFTLFGEQDLDLEAPVRHVSYYEAAAYAAWADAYLPTEIEWEVAAQNQAVNGVFLEEGRPGQVSTTRSCDLNTVDKGPLNHLFGSVWEWTMSPYAAYPGYKPAAGAIGEYNGKFMSSQMVLRGGSSATPAGHIRSTYRNFFPPHARWQISGIRLAR